MRTLLAPAIDGEHVVRDGNLVLDALMRNGDAVGAQAAQVAMQDLSSKIISALLTPSSAGGNKLDEPGDASGIIWHEPGEKLFYSLDDAHGARLSKLLEDMRNAAMYLKRGSRATTRALFIGQAGNGKTKAALWIAAQLGIPVAYVMLAGARSSYIAKGAKNLLACVKAAKERGAALFFDEVEALSARRDTDSPNVSGEDLNTTAALNQIFDAMPPDMIVFGATNVVKKVDPAIARRFRTHITFGPPNRKTRASIIANQWRLITADADAREQLIDGTDGKSGALTEELAEEASNAAARLRGVDAVVTIDEVRQALHHARTETYFADGHAAATAESKIITLGGR